MSAVVSGKRSFFEELSASPPVSKRICCFARFSPNSIPPFPSAFDPSSSSPFIVQLLFIFPEMDKQTLERALEECGNDLDSAIKSLNKLRLGSADRNVAPPDDKSDATPEGSVQLQPQVAETIGNSRPAADHSISEVLSIDGADWVELFVREMLNASNIDDARAHTSSALDVLEKSIHGRVGTEVAQKFTLENMMLKEQVHALIQENTILKRAVSIQHERQKEYEDQSRELQQLKQLVSQYQEQLRTLEVNNYALTMHLKQAQESSSIPGRFHPDVF